MTSTAKGFVYKKGTHWTQKPENRERLIAMNSGKKRRTYKKRVLRAEKVVVHALKKAKKFPSPDETTISINGWKVVLGHNSIKIER